MSMKNARNRIRCPKCNEKLSYSAYMRHKNPLVCSNPMQLENFRALGLHPTETSARQTPQFRAAESSVLSSNDDEMELPDDSLKQDLEPICHQQTEEEGSSSNGEQEQIVHDEVCNSWSSFDSFEGITCADQSTSSGTELENETRLVDDIDILESQLFVQADSSKESIQAERSNVSEIDNSPTDCMEIQLDYYDTVIKPLSIGVFIFQILYRVSDRGINFILSLLSTVMKSIGQMMKNDLLIMLAKQIPQNVYQLSKIFGRRKHDFQLFVVCSKCSTCYNLNTKITEPFTCSTKTGRKVCNTELFRKVKHRGSYKYVPKKVYVYNSVTASLHKLFSKREIITDIEEWRHRKVVENEISDIYDGKVWKELSAPGQFLSKPNNLCLKLNVDWFKLYKHTNYSVGLLYLVIENLPRSKRFNIENVIIVGCIPGPNEPKKNINSFLNPLIDELLVLWHGIQIKTNSYFGFISIRCMLTSVSADIPATRKLCGFSSHNAKRGCSKCLKTFEYETFGSKPDYSGYDRSSWAPRNHADHVNILGHISQKSTSAEKNQLQQQWGIRYSELLRLPYFDIVRNHVIDPMHNLLLGTAKNMMAVWKEQSLISNHDYYLMQQTIDAIRVPAHIGRIPYKIQSNLASLTADQWKNWVLEYSLFAIYSVLPPVHVQCWSTFVEACSMLLKPVLTPEDVMKGDDKLLTFCKAYEDLYGADKCTPNMHLHLHLKDSILDYGPVYAFWCFPFERYNGIFQSFQKNWICSELQIMDKFVNYQNCTKLYKTLDDGHCFWLSDLNGDNHHLVGSLQETQTDASKLQGYYKNTMCSINKIDASNALLNSEISAKYEHFFTSEETKWLNCVYQALYPQSEIVHVPMAYEEFNEIDMFGELFTSVKSSGNHSSTISAYWPVSLEQSNAHCEFRAGVIQYFFCHTACVKHSPGDSAPQRINHIFACIHWLEKHPYQDSLPYPLKVFTTLTIQGGSSIFLPVSRIISRCAEWNTSVKFDFGTENVLLLNPIHKRIQF